MACKSQQQQQQQQQRGYDTVMFIRTVQVSRQD
jgi:hypothetical protein